MNGRWVDPVYERQSGVQQDGGFGKSIQRKVGIGCRNFLHFCGVDFDSGVLSVDL